MTEERSGPRRLTNRIAGTYPLAESYHRWRLVDEMEEMTGEAAILVAGATGLRLPGSPSVAVVDRSQWVERNLATFSHLLAPAEERIAERMAESGPRGRSAAALAHRLLSVETAALLGVLARRVLGQYELVLPTGEDGDVVTFVGPNLLAMERRHHFRPSEFRMWVALHELTHRAQFQGVPWMRGFFLDLVHEMVMAAQPEPGRLARVTRQVLDSRAEGRPLLDEKGLFGLFATPRQHEIIDRIQALMTVLEGHGHVVMDRLGAERLRSQERMSRVLRSRRNDPRTAAFLRVSGLEMKMRQYEDGERFILAVEAEAGWETVGLLFTTPEALPTLSEIAEPARWLRRVA